MATETITAVSDFHGIPPFPDDVPAAPLLRLSLKKLYDEDQDESKRLFQASKDLGFFYLDLRGTPTGNSILRDVDDLFKVGEELFDLDVEEKQKYDFSAQGSYFGYSDQARYPMELWVLIIRQVQGLRAGNHRQDRDEGQE